MERMPIQEEECLSRLICGYNVDVTRYKERNVTNKDTDRMEIVITPSWEDDPYDDMFLLIDETYSPWGTFTIMGPMGCKQIACNIAKKLSGYKKDLEFNQNDVLIGLIQFVMRKGM